jgi:hypothetical protein
MAYKMDTSLGGIKNLDLFRLGIPLLKDTAVRYLRNCAQFGIFNITNALNINGDAEWVPRLKYFLILSSFRVFSILQGVYSRFLKGNASSSQAENYGKQALAYAKIGIDLLADTESFLFPPKGNFFLSCFVLKHM